MSDTDVSIPPLIEKDSIEVEQLTTETDPSTSGVLRLEEHYTHPHIGYACLLQDLRSSLPVLISDLSGVVLAWSATYWICQLVGNQVAPGVGALIALLIAIPVGFFVLRLYPAVTTHPALEIQSLVVGIALMFIGLFASILYAWRPESAFVQRSILFVMMIVCVPVLRMVTRGICSRFRWWRQPTLILGSQEEVTTISKWIEGQWYLGIRPVEYTKSERLLSHPTRVIVAPDAAFSSGFDGDISWSYPRPIFVPDFLLEGPGLAFSIGGSSISAGNGLSSHGQNKLCSPFQQAIKRLVDLTLVFASLPVLIPVFAVLILMVRFSSPGPVFYRQKRLGRNKSYFGAWKFRTMVENADEVLQDYLEQNPELRAEWEQDHKLKDDPRVTKIGRVLRKTSLDELPQLFNVVCGQMSLVGPRPIVDAEIPKYGTTFKQYERVVPGITGMWQISGRNNTTYGERIELDEFYIRNWSIWLDLFILFRTIKTVVFREGAY